MKKEQTRASAIARNHEEWGDNARARFAYVEASLLYERALAQSSAAEHRCELYRKIAFCHMHGARPERATAWFERTMELGLTLEGMPNWSTPNVMRYLARQCWIESRTPEALRALDNARAMCRKIVRPGGHGGFLDRTNALTAYYLVLLGRYSEAATYFVPGKYRESKPRLGLTGSIGRAVYINQQAIVYATRGQAPRAFQEFTRALEAAKGFTDGYYTVNILDDYASWAVALGRLDVARTCYEQALSIARERSLGWRVPYFTMRTAGILIQSGDYEHARQLLAHALTYDTETPILRVLRSTLALELSHILGDPDFVRRIADNDALELTFSSGEPHRIAPIVSAYVRAAVASGDKRRAKKLISQGLSMIAHSDHASDLFALAARYGSLADAKVAKQRLIERTQLPHHRVAQAFLDVWETQMALRRNATSLAHHHAEKAAHAFSHLGWKHQRVEALALVGKSLTHTKQPIPETPPAVFGKLNPVLTKREHQVAECVLQGLTNRAIAGALKISESTVESHMTSILSRFGLRSRWQLIQLARK